MKLFFFGGKASLRTPPFFFAWNVPCGTFFVNEAVVTVWFIYAKNNLSVSSAENENVSLENAVDKKGLEAF